MRFPLPHSRCLKTPRFLGLTVLFLIQFAAALSGMAAEPKLTAVLAEPTVAVGESTTLVLSIQNGGGLAEIPNPKSNGLRIEFRGQSFQTRIENFTASQSIELTYEVSGDAPGTYTIPSTPVQTEKGVLQTPPIQLVVQAGTSAPSKAATSFAEISLQKNSAYIGESIITELKLYVDSRIRWEPETRPNLEGEGFTRLKLTTPTVEKTLRDGVTYDVLVFRIVLTPSKAGKLTIGPCEIRFRAESQQNRSRSPVDSLLGQFFASTQVRSYSSKASAIELEVKPLPVEGRPPDFSGAVGVFQLQAAASPSKVKLGDPITLQTTISGSGNFDRVNAPELQTTAGWNVYPAKSDFQPDEELGMTGRKLFEQALIPESPQTQLPELRFSFFNPETQSYETLKSGLTPIVVEGIPKPTPQTPNSSLQPVTSSPAEPPTRSEPPIPGTQPLLGPRSDFGLPSTALSPPILPKHFLWFQFPPALVLVLLWLKKSLKPSPSKLNRDRLLKEIHQIESQLQEETNRSSFYSLAVRAIQIQAALKARLSDTVIDLETLRQSPQFPAAALSDLTQIFETRNELLYASSSQSQNSLSEKERELVLQKIQNFKTRCAP